MTHAETFGEGSQGRVLGQNERPRANSQGAFTEFIRVPSSWGSPGGLLGFLGGGGYLDCPSLNAKTFDFSFVSFSMLFYSPSLDFRTFGLRFRKLFRVSWGSVGVDYGSESIMGFVYVSSAPPRASGFRAAFCALRVLK